MNDKDRLRFIHDMFEFNDTEKVNNSQYFFSRLQQYKDIRYPYIASLRESKKRKLLINIHAFCLMSNHYHLLVSLIKEGGISLFMRKLNGGYSRYFNQRHQRSGSLFEARYKSVPIITEAHFIHLPYYIHLNPLDYKFPTWRERNIAQNPNQVLDYLSHYRWSSHLDYCGIKNFPSITQREFMLSYYGGSANYKKSVSDWLADFSTSNLRISDILRLE